MHLCNLKHLTVKFMELETMYDLERLQVASPVDSSLETLRLGSLNMLRNICVGPRNLHLSFQNLSKLIIARCHQIKFILPAPISRNLPYLRHLWVLQCKELECIIEDDDEECCFPNLHIIYVQDCESLKCLFSISTCGSHPQLSALFIGIAPKLEQVFERKQDATQELDVKHFFPKLFLICLGYLPKLHTICSAIDFQTVMIREAESCPNISLTSAHSEFLGTYWDWLEKSERNKGNMDELDLFELMVNEEEAAGDEESLESEADEGMDSEQTNKPMSFAAPSQIESPQETMEPISQEGSKLDELALTTNQIMEPESSKSSPTAFVVPSENECPHIPSISTSEKPQIATSRTDEKKLKSSQSDLLDAQSSLFFLGENITFSY
ncbi:hypothetical protein K1719_046442 [Acacia pycnantha]|nr:hypothetical protein K1719_046442 [Acacia pycnantha]